MNDLKVGQEISLTELGQLAGGAAITSEDRIVVVDRDETRSTLAWSRMTVGRLRLWLLEAVEAGEITDETEVWVDSDPEGNDVHPMRAAVTLAGLKQTSPDPVSGRTVLDPEAETVAVPAPAVWFGVGY